MVYQTTSDGSWGKQYGGARCTFFHLSSADLRYCFLSANSKKYYIDWHFLTEQNHKHQKWLINFTKSRCASVFTINFGKTADNISLNSWQPSKNVFSVGTIQPELKAVKEPRCMLASQVNKPHHGSVNEPHSLTSPLPSGLLLVTICCAH